MVAVNSGKRDHLWPRHHTHHAQGEPLVLKHPSNLSITPSVVLVSLACERHRSASPSDKLRRPFRGGAGTVRYTVASWFGWREKSVCVSPGTAASSPTSRRQRASLPRR
jgi:hypothetical protein